MSFKPSITLLIMFVLLHESATRVTYTEQVHDLSDNITITSVKYRHNVMAEFTTDNLNAKGA